MCLQLSILGFVGILASSASRFGGPVPRQYYPFINHNVDLVVTDRAVRVAEKDEVSALRVQALCGTPDDRKLTSATVIYERSVPMRSARHGYQSFNPSYRQPDDQERALAGPEFQVRVLFMPDWGGLREQALPVLAEYIESMFANQELTAGVRQGGRSGPVLQGSGDRSRAGVLFGSVGLVAVGTIGMKLCSKRRSGVIAR